ncbi:MAG: response regulator transcription factor [Eubacteriales bacterium]|nr:response regulator transcription factor [Eubacteriales bacterium]
MRILIVEDDQEINKLLCNFLQENDYETLSAFNGKDALERVEKDTFDLILLDLMLPYYSGEEIIKRIRENSSVPIIVISAKSAVEARLEVLRTGADDFIVKPFDLDEVLVRIQVVLRRVLPVNETSQSELIEIGDLIIDDLNKIITFRDNTINVTAKELQILLLLAKNPLKTFTKANLYETIWNDTYYYEDNTINLRSKLKKATGQDYIETVWGIGYRLKQ